MKKIRFHIMHDHPWETVEVKVSDNLCEQVLEILINGKGVLIDETKEVED